MLLWVAGANGAYAQGEPFEGEIVSESFFQINGDQQLGNMLGNGVHREKAVVKKCKMHSVDEIGDIHSLGDYCEGSFIHFIPAVKLGMDYGKVLNDHKATTKTTGNIEKKPVQKIILGHNCSLYEGTITTETSYEYEVLGEKNSDVINQTQEIKAYVAEDIVAPEAMRELIPGFKVNGIVLQWRIKLITGSEGSHNTGAYMEHDVIAINPRQVGDDEFKIPSDVEILKVDIATDTNSLSDIGDLLKQSNKIEKFNKELEKRKVGAEKSLKTTGVHYQTEGEWDF